MNDQRKRSRCLICLLPLRTCICSLARSIANHVELRILQHPLEVHQAKNTGRLLHLCLNNSQLQVGETFAENIFSEPFTATELAGKNVGYDLLLYPDTPEEKSLGIMAPPAIDVAKIASSIHKGTLRLWVLDATWRKSRKMLYLNPQLQQMPRLKLIDPPASLYQIRKAHSENQLSTLEASCYALRQLENNRVDYAPVLAAFAAFIQQHQTFIASP